MRGLKLWFYGHVKCLECDNILVENSTIEAKGVSAASQNEVNHVNDICGSGLWTVPVTRYLCQSQGSNTSAFGDSFWQRLWPRQSLPGTSPQPRTAHAPGAELGCAPVTTRGTELSLLAQRLLPVGKRGPGWFFPQLLEELRNWHCEDLPGSNRQACVLPRCACLDSLSLEIGSYF